MGIGSGSRIEVVVPEIAVAGGYGFSACSAVIDGEMERHRAVATPTICCRIGRCDSGGGI